MSSTHPGSTPDRRIAPDTDVLQFRGKLWNFIRGRVPDATTADDLTQETLLRVFRSKEHLRDDTKLEAWLFQIARRTVADHYRRLRPTDELSPELPGEDTSPANPFFAAIAGSIRGCVDRLPPLYRAPVLLSELDGLPHAEVARRLRLSLTATKTRVRRGRLLLKECIQQCCRLEFNHAGQITACEPRRPECCD